MVILNYTSIIPLSSYFVSCCRISHFSVVLIFNELLYLYFISFVVSFPSAFAAFVFPF